MGRAIAMAFAKEGADLAINYYNQPQEEVNAVIRELDSYGGRLIAVQGDVTDESFVAGFVEQTLSRFGRIDILVNNAGILTQSLVHEMSVETWDRMIEVDLKSVFLMTRAVVPHMIDRNYGRIINIASQIAQKGGYELSHYAAAKAGVIGFTKSVALELGRHGITANCIAPGPVETRLVERIDPEWKERKKKELAIPRFGLPEEVAPTAVLLASEPDGNLFTGQTLGPNSGDVMP
ncbi:3-oxoacyl-ACP reductase FabG [Paenibacillus sp. P25]|nr:3-oxoacyl-ACP reductase FabG [Paenibacillus sp. P25]